MEVAHVEAVAQRRLSSCPQLQDLQLTDLVAGRLARVGDVALDFLDDVAL